MSQRQPADDAAHAAASGGRRLGGHIGNPTRQSIHIYLKNNLAKFHPDQV